MAVEIEENKRAFWVAETLDSTSTLGAAWRHSPPLPSPPLPLLLERAVLVPCNKDTRKFQNLFLRYVSLEIQTFPLRSFTLSDWRFIKFSMFTIPYGNSTVRG